MTATSDPIHLFYDEADPDRWLPLDRYPRRLIRRVIRGPARPGGQMRVFLNLRAGLDRLGAAYRVNDFRGLRRGKVDLACVVGKPFVLEWVRDQAPILFGAAVFSHPVDDPELLVRLPVRRVLVPGEWCRAMFAAEYGDRVRAWPVGIDTDHWRPAPESAKDIDVLLYDKVRWEHDRFDRTLIDPVRAALSKRGLRIQVLRYGGYREEEFHALLARSRSMTFLCEHETQGIAYQQALSAGVPVLAWDRGGPWQDPSYYPHRVVYGPVSSVPYWDARCGETFADASEFPHALDTFLERARRRDFDSRAYVVEQLSLEKCAEAYLRHVSEASAPAGLVGAAPSRAS